MISLFQSEPIARVRKFPVSNVICSVKKLKVHVMAGRWQETPCKSRKYRGIECYSYLDFGPIGMKYGVQSTSTYDCQGLKCYMICCVYSDIICGR
jgi:hypothetical protein